jgi:signal transduction histidine kinase
MPSGLSNPTDLRSAFAEHDRQETISNFKVACVLGMLLMPAGSVLDYFVYPDMVLSFLKLRLLCSLLIGLFLGILVTPFGQKRYRLLGVTLFMLPASFIAWMIYAKEGAVSPYYAGLNLVLLALAFVLHWTFRESLTAACLIVLVYVVACARHGPLTGIDPVTGQDIIGRFSNNLYFLGLTGIIVATGSYFHSKSRFREFALRFELDKNRRQLEENNQKLKELDQIKGRFFANISHELRTPLTLLLAPLETLLHRFDLDAETKSLLSTMHSNGMRLLKLINDLLDLVRLESGRMEVKREPLELIEFVKGLASAARQVADDKRLRLETFVDPALSEVLADRDKLEKIVLNLVFNALKFTPSGGRVELRAEKQEDRLVLIVADTGMGISEKNLPHVFDRFWQADGSSKRKYQGVGIGLALVKELVEIQGGEVTVESKEGAGTTFRVRLPYQKADPAAQPSPAAEPETATPSAAPASTVTSEEWLANLYRRAELFPALTPVQSSLRPVETSRNGQLPTLLVADDEPDMLRFLKSQLSSHYRVLEAVDGQQAIEKASQFLPDIILLDMMMPEKDGLQACREIREHTATQNTPIVLLTARADEETKLAALSAGASDFLAKPFSTTELHVRIKNLVESHQYQRKVSKQNQALESTIEQLKETETQLVQTEKLASLGRMSAGIIHEINNPLNFAATGLYTLRNKSKYLAPEQQEEYQEILKDVEDGIKRVKNIVSDLRTFTHPDTEGRDQVEVSEVVSASLRFLSNEWKSHVEIVQNLTEHQTIWANKNKLIHVLVNLLQNSLDALKAKTFTEEKPTLWIDSRLAPGKSILVVRDNGTGISAEHLDKIFDPFYTTKDVGAGMGLGLSICYRIVQEYEGRITVRTEAGKFCEFTLEFPSKG